MAAPVLRAAAAPVGVEFRVNETIAGDQGLPYVTGLNDGGFLVVWTSVGQNGDIMGRRYDAAGTPAGGEFKINTQATGNSINDSRTVAAGLGGGGFVVAWDVFPFTEVRARVFNAAASPVTGELLVSNPVGPHQGQGAPTVTGLDNGGFVIAWEASASNRSAIFARIYTASGAATTDVFRVDPAAAISQGYAAVAALGDSRFVIAYQNGLYPGTGNVAARVFTSAGVPVVRPFVVSRSPFGDEQPVVTGRPDGGFIVGWRALRPGDLSNSGILARCYRLLAPCNSNAEIKANTSSSVTSMPAIAALAGTGGFVVTWTASGPGQDGSSSGVYGRRFDVGGAPLGAEFRINTYTADSQGIQSVAPLDGGGYVVVWRSSGQDGSGYGIYGQRFTP